MPLTRPHTRYFTIEQREALQQLLEARAVALRGEIGEDVQADLDAEPEAASLALDVAELRAVQAALGRVHEPDFGQCLDCAADIPFSRMLVNPAATRCVGCQARAEKMPGGESPIPV